MRSRVTVARNKFLFGNGFAEILFQGPVLDFNNQYLAPGGKGTFGSWGKGSSGGTSTKPADSGRFPILILFLISLFYPVGIKAEIYCVCFCLNPQAQRQVAVQPPAL